MPNQEMFDRVLQRISDDPDSLDMRYWYAEKACGTVACLAGHTMMELGWRAIQDDTVTGCVNGEGQTRTIQAVAQKALGLTNEQATLMFAGSLMISLGETHTPATAEDLAARWKRVTSDQSECTAF
jgi:hypothetical protein